jgi:hypothetical protein
VNPLKGLLVVASMALMVGAGFAGPAVAAKGGNKAKVELCKQSVLTEPALRNRGECVSRGAKGVVPQPAGPVLFITTTQYECPGGSTQCWGHVQGGGFQPNSEWVIRVGGASGFVAISGPVTSQGA